MRKKRSSRDVKAGCPACGKLWNAKNAQGVAAKHHDKTGHEVWVEVYISVTYGGE